MRHSSSNETLHAGPLHRQAPEERAGAMQAVKVRK